MAKKKKIKFRLDLAILLSLLILIVVFLAYMVSTDVPELLESENSTAVVTHDKQYDVNK